MARVLTEKQVLLAKYGSEPDTDNVVTLNDSVTLTPKVKTGDYKELGRGLGGGKSYSVPDYTTTDGSVNVLLRAGLPPKIAELYKMCALDETLVKDDDNNVTEAHYKPSQNPIPNGYLTNYLDGEKRIITGVCGNLKATFNVGEMAKLTFELKGFTTPETTLEDNPAVTLDDEDIFIVESIDVITIGGTSYEIENVDFDMGVEIKEIYVIGAKEYQITDYKPKITLKDLKQKGDNGVWQDIANGNVKSIDIKLSTAIGRTFELVANYARLTDVSESDNGGNLENNRTYLLESNSGGDNFEIIYK